MENQSIKVYVADNGSDKKYIWARSRTQAYAELRNVLINIDGLTFCESLNHKYRIKHANADSDFFKKTC